MIGFWLPAALLTLAILVLLAWPLIRRTASPVESESADLAVYRDQLKELERDRARGIIEGEQAVALEAEIGRRMLAAARSSSPAVPPKARASRLAVFIGIAVPVAALSIYLATGRPELPGAPLAERPVAPDADPARILASVDRMKATLKPVKEDLNNWVIIGEAYRKLGHGREAVEALRTAVSLAPDDVLLSAALAEALISADGGTVGEEAKQRFSAVPADSPARPEARYYLALAASQAGDTKAALTAWKSLLAESPADASWVDATRAEIARAAVELGLDPAKETPEPRPAETHSAADGAGPSAADIEASSKMSPDERMKMIRSMVASLAARLDANPDDAEGWWQLARAYKALGDGDQAMAAIANAQAAERKKAGIR